MFVAAHAPAPVVFSDTFSPAPSAFWGDEVGAWTASGGAYFATAPNNNPNAISSLPYNLTDFSVDFDVNNVTDGGIFLRASVVPGGPAGVKGILLNLKVPAGGPRIYWHVFTDGTNATPALNLTNLDYWPNPHVHVEVSGDTYSAFINGSPTPTSTLTTNIFPAGRVALYDFSGQTFSNFVLQVPDQQLFISMAPDAAVIYWSANSTGYVLQTTAALSPTAAWRSLSGPYAVAGGFYEVRLPTINLLHQQFFRLAYVGP
jgi:hypothetical protein